VALPGLSLSAMVTGLEAPLTVPPMSSCTATRTGPSGVPAVALAGWVMNPSRAAGLGVTVTVEVPSFPSDRARRMVEPTAIPTTTPVVETDAIAGLSLKKATVRSVSGSPCASRGVAINCTDSPTRMLGAAGSTTTEATGLGDTLTGTLAVV
jgi:hypothetical protein